MHQLRVRITQMGWEMPLVRTMEHVYRRSGAQGNARGKTCGTRYRSGTDQTSTIARNHLKRGTTHRHEGRRTEPGIRRRTGRRLAHAHRRRAGHREINPHPANRAPPARLESALCIGRRKRTPTETPCRPHPASGRNATTDSLRNIVGANLHPHQEHGSRPGHHRLHPDHIDRSHRLLARKHRASTRMFSRHPEVRQRDRHSRPDRKY